MDTDSASENPSHALLASDSLLVEGDGHAMLAASERRWQLFGPSHLPYRILLLAKMIDRVTSQHVRDRAAMSLAEWRVISHVELMKQCSAAEIAEAAFVDRSEVSRAVAALESRQLIQRDPNPRNRKSSLISLTPEGKAIYAMVREERTHMYEEWLEDLSSEDRAQLDTALRTVMRRIVLSNPDALKA
ncbi:MULTISPECIES: MarR family winged helix-turn-helix transcriptional regulator [unclassified Novosphingobium]|uniref:MarR family winged helix-turn-helix transcriptional regulator n=1 Tax=Novosphingobium TaxID=165696 RepID=UPI00146DB3EB|nr:MULTISPECIES: MarR family transcriptional regulator [unclassified Novosphingobium]NMN04738.1 DNA-binding MarR family transcriptional regulator [Novosphingobium sp. SG919]NMN85268.1 DNA-binding MarR family transcriptional regulator [Novosphingobium sp. SG916]